MRLALIGATGHSLTYAPALSTCPELRIVGVAAASEEDGPAPYSGAPGVAPDVGRYDDPARMLAEIRPDVVQVCCRPDLNLVWTMSCLERGIPVLVEKPIAMDMAGLSVLHARACATNVPVCPMHSMRGDPCLATVDGAVHRGDIGEPLLSFSRKTYKWGASRPDYYRSRETFPGLAPYIGIHAFDWLYRILGDLFVEVTGREGTTARPEYEACASHGGYTLAMANGGVASLTLDYLRPAAAPTHGDEVLRVAGTHGVIETRIVEGRVMLVTDADGPYDLPLAGPDDIATQFIRHLGGRGPAPMSRYDAFRITEIALLAQLAADTRLTVSLVPSAFDRDD